MNWIDMKKILSGRKYYRHTLLITYAFCYQTHGHVLAILINIFMSYLILSRFLALERIWSSKYYFAELLSLSLSLKVATNILH